MLMVLNGHYLIRTIDVSSLRGQQVMGSWYMGGGKEWSIEVSQPTTTRESFPLSEIYIFHNNNNL